MRKVYFTGLLILVGTLTACSSLRTSRALASEDVEVESTKTTNDPNLGNAELAKFSGKTYERLGLSGKAAQMYKEAGWWFEKAGKSKEATNMYERAGENFEIDKMFPEAVDAYEKAGWFNKTKEIDMKSASIADKMTVIYAQTGRAQHIKDLYPNNPKKAAELSEKYGAYFIAGKMYEKAGLHKKAIIAYKKTAEKFDYFPGLAAHAYYGAGRNFEIIGEYQQAGDVRASRGNV